MTSCSCWMAVAFTCWIPLGIGWQVVADLACRGLCWAEGSSPVQAWPADPGQMAKPSSVWAQRRSCLTLPLIPRYWTLDISPESYILMNSPTVMEMSHLRKCCSRFHWSSNISCIVPLQNILFAEDPFLDRSWIWAHLTQLYVTFLKHILHLSPVLDSCYLVHLLGLSKYQC